jgi:predicted  nucleic acid-binding Zn-ribbon protein
MVTTDISITIDYKQLYEQQCVLNAEKDALIASLRAEAHKLRLREVPLSNRGHEYMANLQYKVKSLTALVKAFESGEKYTEMKAASKVQLTEKDREIHKLKAELSDANAQSVSMREKWMQVFDDIKNEHKKELDKKERARKAMEKRWVDVERRLDETKDKFLEKTRELYDARTELEEELGKNQKLKSQLNRDHQNSSISSSMVPNRGKIVNNREKSGKKPGGQPGHKGHRRQRHTPTDSINIPPPDEYLDTSKYKPTGKTITKQMVDIRIMLVVNEYSTPEFRDKRTWQRVHAQFPNGMVNEVNYSGNIKSLAFLLNNHCNVSIGKVAEIISELTGGKLNISTGMICGLSEEFSKKTETEQKKHSPKYSSRRS